MRATGVIARFLSLLDVTLILLGVLMITIANAQLRADRQGKGKDAGKDAAPSLQESIPADMIYVYAGTAGEERGRCYLLGPNRERLGEIRTDRPNDLEAALNKNPTAPPKANRVVMLLISDKGFDSMWDAARLSEIEKQWKAKVVPIYNFRLSQ